MHRVGGHNCTCWLGWSWVHKQNLGLSLIANSHEGSHNLPSSSPSKSNVSHRGHGFSGYMQAMPIDSNRVVGKLQTTSRFLADRTQKQTYLSLFMTGSETKRTENGLLSLTMSIMLVGFSKLILRVGWY